VKSAFRYASTLPSDGTLVVLSEGSAWAVLNSKLFVVRGTITDNVRAYPEGGFTERFKGARMVLRNIDVFYNMATSLTIEPVTLAPSVLNFVCNMSPFQSWTRDITREDFMQRTTHIKIGADGFCRGKLDEKGWRPVGNDAFEGLIYDVRVLNEVWRDNFEIETIRFCDLADDEETPVHFQLGPFYGAIVRVE
jgi:hypothetical protein